jgi:hypothetical protein
MCISCGCGKPREDHGDPRHLTMQDIDAAASAAGISPQEVAANINKSISGQQKGQGS